MSYTKLLVFVENITYVHQKLIIQRHHGSPDLTYGDFIIVQSVWGMTQVS